MTEQSVAAGKSVVRGRDEGKALWMLGGLYEVKVAAEEAGGEVTVMEITVPVNGGPPPHRHNGGEVVYVIEGTGKYHIGDRTVDIGPGSVVYISRGITDELVRRLTRCADLVVFAASTRGGPAPIGDPLEIRRHLAVGYMLRGGVQTRGRRLRISVQLLDLSDGRFLWAEKFDYERNTQDIWTLQERIAETIAACIAAPHGAIHRLASSKMLQEHPHG